jgi:hypothetical protein
VRLANRSGERPRTAWRRGEAGININYGYGGAEPDTNTPFLNFGVAEAGEVAKIFELLPPALQPN